MLLIERLRRTTNGRRGVCHPQSRQAHQQGKGPGEKATKDRACPESPVPIHHEELWLPRKDLSGPEKSSMGEQVRMSCAIDVSSVEGKSSPENLVPVRHEELGQPRKDLTGPDKSSH
ncbi:hypothetical protein TNCT_587951 [Trichonephila clavata]|uniref:Uncharacterized protein n=1 Tax=Trichonephila clavata TaxID=2740835 RepID=A0A8X6FG73_TRICU|nr:hypothetical protein TNCT_587951 [Trichonephila clavata]